MEKITTDIPRIVAALHEGKTLLYPTDTIYGIGCDATNEQAIERVFQIKNRPKHKSLLVLMADLEMLQQYVDIHDTIANLITNFSEPTTVIYNNPRKLAKNGLNADNTIAIRIPKHPFCQNLLQVFGKPIISTSANVSGAENPTSFDTIANSIIEQVDIIADKQFDTSTYKHPSKLIKINPDFSIQYLR